MSKKTDASKSHTVAKVVSILFLLLVAFAIIAIVLGVVVHAVAFLVKWAIILGISGVVVLLAGMKVRSISDRRRARKLEHKYDV